MAGSTEVGVLALQGGVREHVFVLERLGARVRPVRRPEDLRGVDGVVLPGGESSVIARLSRAFGLWEPLRERVRAGMPAFGTCAGLILLADVLEDAAPGQESIGGLDVTVRRNAFGSQIDSFETTLPVPALGAPPVRAVFIRAPLVTAVGPGVETLATLEDGRVVGVRRGPLLGTSFHPELAGEPRLHALFLESARAA